MAQTVAEVLVGVLQQKNGVRQIFGPIGAFLNPLGDGVRRSMTEWIGAGLYEAAHDHAPVLATARPLQEGTL